MLNLKDLLNTWRELKYVYKSYRERKRENKECKRKVEQVKVTREVSTKKTLEGFEEKVSAGHLGDFVYLSRVKERYLQNSLMQCKAMVMQFWKKKSAYESEELRNKLDHFTHPIVVHPTTDTLPVKICAECADCIACTIQCTTALPACCHNHE